MTGRDPTYLFGSLYEVICEADVELISNWFLQLFQGPGWGYETKLPAWASEDWVESDETL